MPGRRGTSIGRNLLARFRRSPAPTLPPAESGTEIAAHVRRIEIRARRLVASIFLGEYHSVFRGRGIEFSEVRQYAPGDDVRAIDWNVTARMGAPYVKQYIEERELQLLLLVDVSASAVLPATGGSKRELAAQVAATLAFSAVANNDRVGLITFSDRIETFVPPEKGRTHVLRIVRELLSAPPGGSGTDIGSALRYAARVSRRRSVIVLLSDFYGEGYEQQLRAAALRHEVIALVLDDRRAAELPDVGLLELEDSESARRVLIDTSSFAVREAYRSRAAAAVTRRRRALTAAGVEETVLHIGEPYVEPLLRAFRARRASRAARHQSRRR